MRPLLAALLLALLALGGWLLRGDPEATTGSGDPDTGPGRAPQAADLRPGSEERQSPTTGRERQGITITPASISGLILDEQGRPLPGVRVRALDPEGRARARARSDAEGRFELSRPSPRTDTPTLETPMLETWHGSYQDKRTGPVAWGTRDLRIELRALPGLRLFVTRESDDRPVNRFSVYANWELQGSATGAEHPHGEAVITGLPSYVDSRFMVVPEDPGLAPSPAIRVDGKGRLQRDVVRVKLPSTVYRVVRLRGLDPAALAQVVVRLGRPALGWKASPESSLFWPKAFAQMRSTSEAERSSLLGSHKPVALCLFGGKPGADGRLRIRAAPREDYFLRITGPCVPRFVHPVEWREGLGPLEVELQPGVTVLVEVVLDAELRKALPTAETPKPESSPFAPMPSTLQLHVQRIDEPKATHSTLLDQKARCKLQRLAPGTYRTWLTRSDQPRFKLDLLPNLVLSAGMPPRLIRLQPAE